ncbi:Y-family DNA polymerase [Methylopila turkensis]|uniref:DNA-directed DNA polymerase n=1 Tax=Methylopila turkensis TaxID=1437816 RepID=A0A9W6JPF9_9HYPH|nr:DNA polymerase Y family protein [Methylopila turkensis]GLK80857.1 DNA-directed DNA polymerase [Methylopila turkensis]
MTAHPSSLRRYLALWFPFLPADRLLRMTARHGGAPAEPLVLVHSVKGALRLAAASREASALGLTFGLTLADARARIPGLVAADHDPAADDALLARMAETCDRWTPLVALDPPHGLILDITGCAHLFGGEADLRRRIAGLFRRNGLATRAAIAGTPDAARALARYGRVPIAPPGGEAEAVRPLTVAALGLAEDVRRALSLAGLTRIADLADRPSRPLAARFGEDLPTRLRRTLGEEDRRITPLRPRPACRVQQMFAEPIAHNDAIEATIRDLLGKAMELLEAAGQGGRAFEASFFRTDGAVRRVDVATGRPTRDVAAVLRLLRARIEALADPLDPGFGFDLIRLAVPVAEPLAQLQPQFDGETREDEAVSDLVDRLVARFGASRVLRFSAADSHDPTRASRLVPATSLVAATSASPPPEEPGEPPLRPLRMFDPPQPIETLAETPDGPPLRFRWRRVLHSVARAEGPERIAPEWWREPDAPTRDYYRVEDAEGRRFWVFRAGLYERETDRPRWYLHGLFA